LFCIATVIITRGNKSNCTWFASHILTSMSFLFIIKEASALLFVTASSASRHVPDSFCCILYPWFIYGANRISTPDGATLLIYFDWKLMIARSRILK
jgi:hypothetical protein